jgi:hypothetical protein
VFVQREEQPYYTPEEVEQMFNSTPTDASAHNTTKNHTDSSGKDKDSAPTDASALNTTKNHTDSSGKDKDKDNYKASTATNANTPGMLPGPGDAPFETSTDTPGFGNQKTGSGRHLLDQPQQAGVRRACCSFNK